MPGNAIVQTKEVSWRTEILRADPEFYAKQKREVLWEFSNGKEFRGDHSKVNTAYPDA